MNTKATMNHAHNDQHLLIDEILVAALALVLPLIMILVLLVVLPLVLIVALVLVLVTQDAAETQAVAAAFADTATAENMSTGSSDEVRGRGTFTSVGAVPLLLRRLVRVLTFTFCPSLTATERGREALIVDHSMPVYAE